MNMLCLCNTEMKGTWKWCPVINKNMQAPYIKIPLKGKKEIRITISIWQYSITLLNYLEMVIYII